MSYEVKADVKKLTVTVEELKKNYVNAQIKRLNNSIEFYERGIKRWTLDRHLQPEITDEQCDRLLQAFVEKIKNAQSQIKELEQS